MQLAMEEMAVPNFRWLCHSRMAVTIYVREVILPKIRKLDYSHKESVVT
jgi:hypothetical protein